MNVCLEVEVRTVGRKPSPKTVAVEQGMDALAVLDVAEKAIQLARKALLGFVGRVDGQDDRKKAA